MLAPILSAARTSCFPTVSRANASHLRTVFQTSSASFSAKAYTRRFSKFVRGMAWFPQESEVPSPKSEVGNLAIVALGANLGDSRQNIVRGMERLEELGIGYRAFGWYPLGLKLDVESPGKLLENLLGYIHIQEELSMVPPLVLDPQPGEMILDLCASPGSKTTQISAMMENRGLVIANEPSLARISALRSNCERLGAMNVAITRYDGRRFPSGSFHRVLVDAPCSAEGRERRGPGVIERSCRQRSLDLQVLQIGLLRNALRLTRPGGVVVYSTCTYAPEENEMVVAALLDEADDCGGSRLEQVKIPGLQDCGRPESGDRQFRLTACRE